MIWLAFSQASDVLWPLMFGMTIDFMIVSS